MKKQQITIILLIITNLLFSQNVKEIIYTSSTPMVDNTISKNEYKYSFDNGKLASKTNKTGGPTKFNYNELGQLSSAITYKNDDNIFKCEYFEYNEEGIINKTYTGFGDKCKSNNILGGSDIILNIKDSLNFEIIRNYRNDGNYKASLKYTSTRTYKRKKKKFEITFKGFSKPRTTKYEIINGNISSRDKKDVFSYKYDNNENLYLALLEDIFIDNIFINSLIFNPFEYDRYSHLHIITANNPTESNVEKSTNYQPKVNTSMKYVFDGNKLTEINSVEKIKTGKRTSKTIIKYE